MIPVVVLGASRLIGQALLQRLAGHPAFAVRALCDFGPERAPMPFGKVCDWRVTSRMPTELATLDHHSGPASSWSGLSKPGHLVLSVLPDGQSAEADRAFADGGARVITHAEEWRLHPNIPLIIPDIHPIPSEPGIIATPNCTTVMLSLLLTALRNEHRIDAVSVVALQALSGADLSGPSAMDMLGNVDPHLDGEARALERETGRIFSEEFPVSARCVRVPVNVGHTLLISFKTRRPGERGDILTCLDDFRLTSARARTETALERPFVLFGNPGRPRPVPDADVGRGMALSIGGIARCPVLDWRCVLVGNNVERGSAATMVLTAELLAQSLADF